YDEYQRADPGGVGWALERQIFDWAVPFHRGAVRYFKSIGVWTDKAEANNKRLIQRQDLLADTWAVHVANSPNADSFETDWYVARASALEAAGFDPVWQNPEARGE
ncbi:MAG: hypothetical protein ACI9UU_002466, partial [Candidatus Azotimanducaceae bacterium]